MAFAAKGGSGKQPMCATGLANVRKTATKTRGGQKLLVRYQGSEVKQCVTKTTKVADRGMRDEIRLLRHNRENLTSRQGLVSK